MYVCICMYIIILFWEKQDEFRRYTRRGAASLFLSPPNRFTLERTGIARLYSCATLRESGLSAHFREWRNRRTVEGHDDFRAGTTSRVRGRVGGRDVSARTHTSEKYKFRLRFPVSRIIIVDESSPRLKFGNYVEAAEKKKRVPKSLELCEIYDSSSIMRGLNRTISTPFVRESLMSLTFASTN